jgi:hypothetical protein
MDFRACFAGKQMLARKARGARHDEENAEMQEWREVPIA